MAESYKTSEPKFLEYIYQPNYEMQTRLSQEKVKADMIGKELLSKEFTNLQTFDNWKGSMGEKVNALQEELSPALDALVKNSGDTSAIKTIKSVASKAKEEYFSGDIGKMASMYQQTEKMKKDFSDRIKSEKDATSRAEMQNIYNQWTHKYLPGKVGEDYNPDFNVNPIYDYVNAQGVLKKEIDPKEMKNRMSSPDFFTKTLVQDSSGNHIGIPEGSVEIKDAKGKVTGVKLPDGAVSPIYSQQELLTMETGIPYNEMWTSTSTEGYNTNLIESMAKNSLSGNRAYLNMLNQAWEDFGGKDSYDGTKEQYISEKINSEASSYAAQFSGKKVDVTGKIIKDADGLSIAKTRRKEDSKKKESYRDITLKTINEDVYTNSQVDAMAKTYTDGVIKYGSMTPQQIKNLKGKELEAYNTYNDSSKVFEDIYGGKYGNQIIEAMGGDPLGMTPELIKASVGEYIKQNIGLFDFKDKTEEERRKIAKSLIGEELLEGLNSTDIERAISFIASSGGTRLSGNITKGIKPSEKAKSREYFESMNKILNGLQTVESVREVLVGKDGNVVDSFKDELKKNIHVQANYAIGSTETKGGSLVLGFISDMISTGVNPFTLDATQSYYDHTGKPMPNTVGGRNQLQEIVKASGKTLEELVEEKSLSVSMKPEGNGTYTIRIEDIEPDLAESLGLEDGSTGFKQVYNKVTDTRLESAFRSDPSYDKDFPNLASFKYAMQYDGYAKARTTIHNAIADGEDTGTYPETPLDNYNINGYLKLNPMGDGTYVMSFRDADGELVTDTIAYNKDQLPRVLSTQYIQGVKRKYEEYEKEKNTKLTTQIR